MIMVYFIGREKFDGIENIVLNEIRFYQFNVNLNDFDCLIISSKNSLKSLIQSSSILNFNISLYAVGSKSAQFAKSIGFVNVKYPSCAYGKNLAEEFLYEFKNKKCLYLRAKKISSCIDTYLLNNGINLHQVVAYENIALKIKEKMVLNHPAVFIFSE